MKVFYAVHRTYPNVVFKSFTSIEDVEKFLDTLEPPDKKDDFGIWEGEAAESDSQGFKGLQDLVGSW